MEFFKNEIIVKCFVVGVLVKICYWHIFSKIENKHKKIKMKKFIKLLGLFIATLICFEANAQNSLSGVVFRDFNGNGQKDNTATFNEPFVAGISVRAFNAANVQVGPTKTTSATGAYNFLTTEIANGTAVRVEFNNLTAGDFSSFSGTGNASSIQFVTTSGTSTANFAISAPDDYWNNVSETNPVLAVVKNKRGRFDGAYNGNATIIQINNNTQSTTPAANSNEVTIDTGQTVSGRRAATHMQTGSIFGAAFQQRSQRFFSTAVLKRGHGFGPQGPGGIYVATKGATYLSYAASFTLEGVTPSNGGGVLNFGTVTRTLAADPLNPTAAEISNNNYLAGTYAWQGVVPNGSDSRDMDAFAKVGTMSYGDIEADKATDKLYTINLFQRKLIVLDIENTATATLNNASAATLSPLVRAYDMTTLPGWPTVTGTGNNLRPYGIKVYKGVGYVGVVNDGMATQNRAHLIGYILTFNPNNITAGFTNLLSFNFTNYGQNYSFQNHMHPWVTTWAQAEAFFGNNPSYLAQPMIAGFEFNEDESMEIAIRDRWGDQGCTFEFVSEAGSTDHIQTVAMGDLLHAFKSGSTWVLESNATQPAANTIGAATNNSFGEGSSYSNTGKEFYADRSGDGQPESCQAGITKLIGTQRIVTSVVDPIAQGATVGSNYWSTQGVSWNNTTSGNKTQWARLEGDASTDKSNGMGDIEYITLGQSIQIGNRIWMDTNGNGIQDAGETTPGVATGTTVNLYTSTGVLVATTTTDANGNYYFSNLNVTADPRKPATWTGLGATLLPGYDYRIEVATPTGAQLTKSNTASNTVDNIDNDAIVSGSNAIVTFNTNNTNHNFDIGFKTLASLGDKVWLDNGVGSGTANDGLQNGTEPGVAGVTVTLYASNGTTVIATTVTDAYGNYLFDNLTPATYVVGFTLPSNYQFTTQTNTTDDGNTTGSGATVTSQNGSDANVTTGKTYGVVLSAGENNRNVDAGLIFNSPILPNSIGDRVWFDNGLGGGTASNGVQDGAEPGVAGVTVQLLDDVTGAVLATTVTDANGNYIFTNLPPSTNYKIKVIPPSGTVFSTSTATTAGNTTTNSDVEESLTASNYGTTSTVNTGAAGTQITGIDAGIVSQAVNTASLGDKVWNDLNNNGTQDVGEPGIAGVTVNLYEDVNGDGVLTGGELLSVRTTITDVFGNYIFNNLVVTANNKWQVEFAQPVGYNNTSVSNNNSGNDATDSDIINNTTDRTDFIRLKFDERNTSVDAGFVSTATGTLKLGDKVWRDDDSDGIQDATEPGVAGVTAKLYTNGADGLPGTVDDILVATTSTDINGNYLFTNLTASTPGTASTYYNVQFSNVPTGFSFTTQTNTQNAAGTITSATGGSTVANGNDANVAGKTGSYSLTADNLDVDAGIKQGVASGKGSLGNKVWIDLAGGTANVQDATEPGVAGVTVNLYRDVNGDGIISGAELTPIATETTNALGEYIFDNLDAGSYQVGFSNLPSGYTLVTRDAGTSDNLDSDGNALNTSIAGNTAAAGTSYTALIPLAQGEDNLSVDLGLTPPANTNTLGNKVWWDQNGDGLQAGEPGVGGVVVTLYNNAGTAIATTTTDANGEYLFTGLADGTYSVGFSNLPSGFDFTTKETTNDPTINIAGSDADRVSGRSGTVTLNFAAGTTQRDNRSLDAGIISTRAALGNKVWDDLDGDGIQDAGEPGVPGVTVTLYAADGTTVISSTITDQNGNYLFANLNEGTYVVGFGTLPNGKTFTAQDNTTGPDGDGANTATGGGDSDVNPSTGKTATVTLTAGQLNLTVDAGIRSTPVATVGNRVWDDLDGDGVQEAGEPGIPGVVATLYNSSNQPIGSAVTGANGEWLITNVPVGTGYYVIFTNKPAGNWTIQDIGGAGTGGGTDNDTDSDVNGSGQTGAFNVTASDMKIVIDAGINVTMILPVKFTNFTAIKQGNTSHLQFSIAQAAPSSVFTIERSINGLTFTAIGSINGTNATTYQYIDYTPELNSKNYYRIKEVDLQGIVTVSDIKTLSFTKSGNVSLYPIPTAAILNISFDEANIGKAAVINVYDMQGKAVYTKAISKLSNLEKIDLSSYSNGNYQVVIFESNSKLIVSKKIVIIK
jgi:hypothetical protein